jgi:hypothetical protein
MVRGELARGEMPDRVGVMLGGAGRHAASRRPYDRAWECISGYGGNYDERKCAIVVACVDVATARASGPKHARSSGA